jgi:hypothetical protein
LKAGWLIGRHKKVKFLRRSSIKHLQLVPPRQQIRRAKKLAPYVRDKCIELCSNTRDAETEAENIGKDQIDERP